MRILLLLLAIASLCRAQELTVAAAADLRPALDEIAAKYKAASGANVNVIYGSSGSFYQQIQNGAPFDVFFSANVEYPKKLEYAGLSVPSTYQEFARGKIVLMVSSSSTLDLKKGLKLLLDPSIRKVAIADPSHAPYGQAAVAALRHENVYDQISAKLVSGDNVSQAASFVLSGAAEVGIVALSIARLPAMSKQARLLEIPPADYPPIVQACVVLKSSRQPAAAKGLEDFVHSREAQEILQRFGFEALPR